MKKIIMKEQVYNTQDISRLLMDAYLKILRVDLDKDTYDEIKVNDEDIDGSRGYAPGIFSWIKGFAEKGNIYEEDMERFLAFTDKDRLLREFSSGKSCMSISYRRKTGDEFRWVKMVLRKSYDYSEEHHIIILCIEDIHDETMTMAEVEHTNAALKEAFSAAVAANSAKSEFMSRMSHDIRTPLNGIIGMTAIAGAHMDDLERVEDCLVKITSASRHLLSLINDILDLSKIESGKVSLTDADFNLPEMLDDLLGMVHGTVEQRHHELNVYVHNVIHENVTGDNVRLQQVFMNLVSNAIKYTPDHGRINISLTELPSGSSHIGQYQFVCEDNGYGMSQEFQEKLFEPFERADDTRIGNIQGTGLGMTIARNIVNMMGGDIQVESRENVGSRFTVTFRIKLQSIEDMNVEELLDLPVLVVDDDEIICESTCITLGELGMKGDYCLTGEEAVDKVTAAHENAADYFACLIDWKMPGMDGIETTRRIRKTVGTDMPIIIISAYEWEEIEEDARQAGADAFISKPLFKSRLHAALTELPRSLRNGAPENTLESLREKDYSSRRLLLVEDNELNREIAEEILRETGAQVESAENGSKAVEMYEHSKPGYYDMIFMDIRMPVMDGYKASETIRSIDRKDAKEIPIIALTANAFVEDVARVHHAGMNEHMAKPIDLPQLLNIMEAYL